MSQHRRVIRSSVTLLLVCRVLLNASPAAAEDADAGVRLPNEARLEVRRSIDYRSVALPQSICNSEIECGRIGATVLSSCGTERADGYHLEPVLLVTGRIFYYAGPLAALGKRPRTDRSVKDHASIRTHVAEWHVEPAIDAVRPLLAPLTAARFLTREECVAVSQRLALDVQSTFSKAVRETQALENRSVDVPRFLRSQVSAGAGPA